MSKAGQEQIGVHITSRNDDLLTLISAAKDNGLTKAVMGEAAMRLAWKNFPDQVLADAKALSGLRVPGGNIVKWTVSVKEENERLKKEIALLKSRPVAQKLI